MAAPSDAVSHDPDGDARDHLLAAGASNRPRAPRTPPPPQSHHPEHPHHHHHHHHHHAHSPLQAPNLPSPMSLYQLGIAPLSPLSLRRQLSLSPRAGEHGGVADGDEEGYDHDDDDDIYGDENRHGGGPDQNDDDDGDDDDDLTRDSRDVLVDRLNDLVQRLSADALREDSVSALHAKVDEMEKVLAGREPRGPRRPSAHSRPGALRLGGGGSGSSREATAEELDPLGIMSPSWFMPQLYGHDSTQSSLPPGPPPDDAGDDGPGEPPSPPLAPSAADARISSEVAERIVREAEKLYAEMAEVVKSMQDRREESDHLHGLFIEREERAAQRIIELERQVAELEDEMQESESELRFLRLQLRAIEVQCLEYMPPDADPELVQSIQNWKSDWASLHRKWAARRGGLHDGDSSFVTVSSARAR